MIWDGKKPEILSGREEPTDEQLVSAYQGGGSVVHLDVLFSRHVARIRTLTYQMVLNNHDADDITQEVFLRAAHALNGFQGDCRFSTWLYRIAVNCANTFLAKRNRRREEFTEDYPEPVAPVEERPDRACQHVEIRAKIQAALQELSPKLRAAIVLTTLHDMSIMEAAKVEACSVATLYWRVHEARRQLSKRLKGGDLPEGVQRDSGQVSRNRIRREMERRLALAGRNALQSEI